MTRDELNKLLTSNSETEHLEFKVISGQISILGKDKSKLNRKSVYGYCVAIGNEGGGYLVLGVKNKINPSTGMRDIVGTSAIPNIQKAEEEIYKVLRRKIKIQNIDTEMGKVQIVHIPSHPTGEAFRFFGVHLMRNGENLEEMDNGTLTRINNETRNDFSAQINEDASLEDLDAEAVKMLKKKWLEKKQDKDLETYNDSEVLEKLLLVTKKGVTNACLLLVGKSESLARLIPCAEVFLEWRLRADKLEHDLRQTLREPYIILQEKIWNFVNSRNTRVSFREGFFEQDIWAYDKESVDEATLNAFAHREYRDKTEPIYIRVSPDRVSVKSAGGFLPGVSAENALYVEGQWRNRRLMEVLGEIGLVERAGIGLDRIYKASISQGKGLPDFEGTTGEHVILNVPAKIKDLNFVYYLQKIQAETQVRIDTVTDFIELEYVRENGKAKNKERLSFFLSNGIVEKVGKGRGVKFILAKSFYEFIDNRSEYTRKKWLSKEQQKQVLLNYLIQYEKGRKEDFKRLFEGRLSDHQIYVLLNELRGMGKVVFEGGQRSRTAYWQLVGKK